MGWIKKPRSTGWWDITGRVQVPVTGQILVMRDQATVWLDLRDFAPSPTETVGSIVLTGVLPPGLRPPRDAQPPLGPRVHDAANEIKGAVRVYPAGNLAFYRVNAGSVARGMVAFPTDEPFPSTLPGGVKL